MWYINKVLENLNIVLKYIYVSLWVLFVCYFLGLSLNIEIINLGFNGKEMSIYEIIYNYYLEENFYIDIGIFDIVKVYENGVYYDIVEFLEDKNMYLCMLDVFSEEM